MHVGNQDKIVHLLHVTRVIGYLINSKLIKPKLITTK